MNETGSIPFFTSANSSRSWVVFFGATVPLGEGGGWGAVRGPGGSRCRALAGVEATGASGVLESLF